MITKSVIVKGKKVSIQTTNETNGKTRTYHLGKTKVFKDVFVTTKGFSAVVIARDGGVAMMDITISNKGKIIGCDINHPKFDLSTINTKNEVTLSVKKK